MKCEKECRTMYCIKRLLNPDIFQGKNKKQNYFEGWYFKISDYKMENTYAIILMNFNLVKKDLRL